MILYTPSQPSEASWETYTQLSSRPRNAGYNLLSICADTKMYEDLEVIQGWVMGSVEVTSSKTHRAASSVKPGPRTSAILAHGMVLPGFACTNSMIARSSLILFSAVHLSGILMLCSVK